MPHVIVKLWPGKSQKQKRELTDAISQSVKTILEYGDDAVSVGIEEVSSSDWNSKVYMPDIASKWDSLIKKPGYGTPRSGTEK
jgi:4-oxalocrotonate tautomerase